MRAFLSKEGQLCFEESDGRIVVVRKTKNSAVKYNYVTRHYVECRQKAIYTAHGSFASANKSHSDLGCWTPVWNGNNPVRKKESVKLKEGFEYKIGKHPMVPYRIWLYRYKMTHKVFPVEK